MALPDSTLLAILAVGRDTSIRSNKGLSLNDALARVNYLAVRPQIDSSAILKLLRTNTALVNEWVQYSEDKRTPGGWHILAEKSEIGLTGVPESILRFASLDEAVAEYVLRELDFWAGVRGAA